MPHYVISEPEPDLFASKRFLITLTLGLTFIILFLAYNLYNAYKNNQRLQIELDSINETIQCSVERGSEETDSEFYKQMNLTEPVKDSKEPTTPPSSPTIEDYDSGKRKKKLSLDLTKL